MSREFYDQFNKRWSYRCDWCERPFVWSDDSLWFGSLRGADEGKIATFCCADHGHRWDAAGSRNERGELRQAS